MLKILANSGDGGYFGLYIQTALKVMFGCNCLKTEKSAFFGQFTVLPPFFTHDSG